MCVVSSDPLHLQQVMCLAGSWCSLADLREFWGDESIDRGYLRECWANWPKCDNQGFVVG